MNHNYHHAWAVFSRPESRGGPKGGPFPMNATIRVDKRESIRLFCKEFGMYWPSAYRRGYRCKPVKLSWKKDAK